MFSHFETFSYFRPDDESLTPRAKFQIQLYRLLSLLGAVLFTAFGLARAVFSPEDIDPLWIRLAISGLLLSLFAASYTWKYVRRNYGTWGKGLFYGFIAWGGLLATLNQFASDYTVSFLLLFMVGASVIGFQTLKVRPILWFAGFSSLVIGVGVVLGPPSKVSPVFLFASIATVALIDSLLLFWGVSSQETIRQQEEKLQIIAANISDGIYRSAPGEGLVYANQAFAEMFGYERVEDILAVEPGSLYASPGIRDGVRKQAKEQGTLGPVEVELQRKDGSTFMGLIRGSVVWGEDGTVQFYDGVVTDITERKRRERELARRKAMLEAQAEATIDGLLVVDNERDISFYNERFLEIWDIPKDLVHLNPTDVSLDQVLLEAVTNLLPNPDEFQEKVEYLYDHPDESSRDLVRLTDGRWIDRYSAPIGGEDGSHFGRLWVFRDVAEQKRREQKLQHEATHDELTGLPNRAALQKELEALIGTNDRETLSALLYLDLDDFKQVNDRWGHNVGDRILVAVADRLETVVRDTDLVARLGGDEFIVCLTEATDVEAVGRVARRIYDELGEAFEVEGQEVYAPPSIGVVTRLDRFASVEGALREADTAMYEAKRFPRTAGQPDRPFVMADDSAARRVDMEVSAGRESR